MQNFISTLFQKIKPFHLLKHPFYNKWSNGELNKEVLILFFALLFFGERKKKQDKRSL